mmetsp:Transcript_40880/g.112385  ORF Transcript_40880/g.112385 Transcript_40880/m.112385 type:complete len:148 (-) Transcript_40880:5-448(-)
MWRASSAGVCVVSFATTSGAFGRREDAPTNWTARKETGMRSNRGCAGRRQKKMVQPTLTRLFAAVMEICPPKGPLGGRQPGPGAARLVPGERSTIAVAVARLHGMLRLRALAARSGALAERVSKAERACIHKDLRDLFFGSKSRIYM